MATHRRVTLGEIPWKEEPDESTAHGARGVGHDYHYLLYWVVTSSRCNVSIL